MSGLMDDEDDVLWRQRLRNMQIVAGALLGGVVVFFGIVLYVVQVQHNGQGLRPPASLPIMTLVAALMLTTCVAYSFFIPWIMANTARRQIAAGVWQPPPGTSAAELGTVTGRLMIVRQTTLIVGLAPLEGSAFIACIAYLLDGLPYALGLLGVAVLLMLVRFPTEAGVRSWMDRQTELLDQPEEPRTQ